MIVYDLICSKEHRFETWFPNGAAYEKQRKAKVVECPLCGDVDVRKAPMAPALARSGRGEKESPDGKDSERNAARHMMETMAKLRRYVEDNCDYVGERFAEEARRIHHGETEARGIYGEASEQETRKLDEEGITVQRLPSLPKRND